MQRISDFRALGLIQNLPEEFSTADVIESYLTGGANNQDFVSLYQEVYKIIHSITVDSEFLEHLHGDESQELLKLITQLKDDVSLSLEPAVNDIIARSTTVFELATYIGTIPAADFDEHAQILLEAAEIFRNYNDPADPDHQKLHDNLNQKLIARIEHIRVLFTQIEDLALLLDHLIRNQEAAVDAQS